MSFHHCYAANTLASRHQTIYNAAAFLHTAADTAISSCKQYSLPALLSHPWGHIQRKIGELGR